MPQDPKQTDRLPFQGIGDTAPLVIKRDDLRLGRQIRAIAHTDLAACYQCRTCSGGCPVFGAMDFGPHGVMRLIQLGQRQTLLASNTIWLCLGCHTCSAACPMGIDIASVMDTLRQMALAEGAPVAEPGILEFHREVLRSIERYGRTHKLEIMLRYKAKAREFFSDVEVGFKMLAKRKLDLKPSQIDDPAVLRHLFTKPWKA